MGRAGGNRLLPGPVLDQAFALEDERLGDEMAAELSPSLALTQGSAILARRRNRARRMT